MKINLKLGGEDKTLASILDGNGAVDLLTLRALVLCVNIGVSLP